MNDYFPAPFKPTTDVPTALQPDAASQLENYASKLSVESIGLLDAVKSKVPPEAAKSAALSAFEKETGLTATLVPADTNRSGSDSKQYYRYSLSQSLDKHPLFQTAAGDAGLTTAREALDRLIEEKSKALENKFGISIARSGENSVTQITVDGACNVHQDTMIKTRSATLPELIGLQAALEHSQPSERGGDGKGPVKIYFLTKQWVEKGDAAAHYVQSDSGNHRAIYVDPEMLQDVPILAKDNTVKDGTGFERYYSIQAIFTHELGHNSEFNMGWDKPGVEDKVAQTFGWARYNNPDNKSTGWLIEGKKNNLFKYDNDNCHTTASWISSDSKGDRLNAKGLAVRTVSQAKHIGAIEKLAKYPPATDYFTNPREEMAEGLMMYRLSSSDRVRLFEKKPQLYWAVKKHDQAEIDQAYGQNEGGESAMIRSLDGLLVANDAASRAAVTSAEINRAKK